jgi:heme/copper-type cytochrome/quinol oxidase subunit 3
LPFYNTVLLVSSGVVVTWAHVVLSTPRRIVVQKIPIDYVVEFVINIINIYAFWGVETYEYFKRVKTSYSSNLPYPPLFELYEIYMEDIELT